MKNLKGVGLALLGFVTALLGLGWLGLRARPKPLSHPAGKVFTYAPLPPDLPEPVKHHYKLAYGEEAPVAETAVLLGRAQFKMGLWMQMRFAAYHLLGQNFLRNMEVTWFDKPFLQGQDTYINGKGMMNINGQITDGFEIDQAACINIWCEAIMFPFAGNGRIRWEPINNHHAHLFMPFDGGEEEAVVGFDPVTGFMRRFTAMRYRDKDHGKIRWHVDYHNWTYFDAGRFPKQVTVTWEDEGTPWFIAELDDVLLNVEIPNEMKVLQTTWEDVLLETAV